MKDLDKVYAEQIASEYAPKTTTKIVRLKKLDNKVKNPPLILAFTLGIIGTLVFGTGMCLAMKVIGPKNNLGIGLGVAVGVVGMIIDCINYPIYTKWLKARKAKYAFEITELAKEISED